ncbi:TauD/TfdA family dioxygenase [Sphingobium baderi]|uniref:TauD/TfdA family dioxygenase n=1 Tax=Sphingobium baderi TaxID=1332080 RepID=UPI002B402B18|nr:TauD/TfdA family dioxygenase [Sphingobium baderi]WRD75510.1 TauD/TfdA family dioxygenase [Sphingobium baderi]
MMDSLTLDRGALPLDDVSIRKSAASGAVVTLEPRAPELARDPAAFLGWFDTHRPALEQLIAREGPVRMHGFAVTCTQDFSALACLYDAPREGYVGGATPRSQLAERVFEATRSPPEHRLIVHQEMAYLPRWPRKILFYCAQPSRTGGETITADVRSFDRLVPARLRDAVCDRGVRYIRNFRGPGEIPAVLASAHRSWQEAFYTDDPAEAEAACTRMGLSWRWLDDGSLSAEYSAPGLVTHPLTGETLWFNHIHSQTMMPESEPARWEAYDAWYADGRPKGYEVRFGDGGEIPLDDVRHIFGLLDKMAGGFRWAAGDLLLIDNIVTFHGRNPFEGERNVQVALLEEGEQ